MSYLYDKILKVQSLPDFIDSKDLNILDKAIKNFMEIQDHSTEVFAKAFKEYTPDIISIIQNNPEIQIKQKLFNFIEHTMRNESNHIHETLFYSDILFFITNYYNSLQLKNDKDSIMVKNKIRSCFYSSSDNFYHQDLIFLKFELIESFSSNDEITDFIVESLEYKFNSPSFDFLNYQADTFYEILKALLYALFAVQIK